MSTNHANVDSGLMLQRLSAKGDYFNNIKIMNKRNGSGNMKLAVKFRDIRNDVEV